jgi:hypothetical protein
MPQFGIAALILALTCIGVANMVGHTMSREVSARNGQSYWPPAANTRLARDYRQQFGPDRNYVVYGLSHFASLALFALAAISAAF